MTEQSVPPAPSQPPTTAEAQPPYVQLTQARVPLDEAATAFGVPDSTGRLPIVLMPSAPNQISSGLVISGVAAIVIGPFLNVDFVLRGGIVGIGAALIFLGVFRSFRLPVPEGSQAILLRRGRVDRTIGPGNHIVPPWIAVSHLVTTREIPFNVPVVDVPTEDGVRISVDVLLTFRITEPARFIFAISAPDFDQVCQAAGQDALRMQIRSTTTAHVLDLAGTESGEVAKAIGKVLHSYGVVVERVVILNIRPPDAFMRSLEGRRLATQQREEAGEQHALEQRRQADRESLQRQRAESQRQIIELEAANEAVRLERLQERLNAFPTASRYDLEAARLEVARALAGNTRAMVQVGAGGDIASALVLRDLADADPDVGGSSSPADRPATTRRPKGPPPS